MKIIAVVNDNTGEVYAVLNSHEHMVSHQTWLKVDEIKQIRQFGVYGEDSAYIIRWGNLNQVVDTRNYSVIEVME